MTDPTEIARGIVSSGAWHPEQDLDSLEVLIAAALREYGETYREAKECSHCSGVLQLFQMKYWRGCLCRCHEGTYEEADAEGYRRGRVDEAKECDAHAKREYRRGVEEPCGNCGVRKDDDGRTRGTGGGERVRMDTKTRASHAIQMAFKHWSKDPKLALMDDELLHEEIVKQLDSAVSDALKDGFRGQ